MMRYYLVAFLLCFMVYKNSCAYSFGIVSSTSTDSSSSSEGQESDETSAAPALPSGFGTKLNFIRPEFGKVQSSASNTVSGQSSNTLSESGIATAAAPVVLKNTGFQLGKVTTGSGSGSPSSGSTLNQGIAESEEGSSNSSSSGSTGFKFGQVSTGS